LGEVGIITEKIKGSHLMLMRKGREEWFTKKRPCVHLVQEGKGVSLRDLFRSRHGEESEKNGNLRKLKKR